MIPECQYDDVDFSDCDPFTLKKYRGRNLISGGVSCEKHMNETEQCSPNDFPPGESFIVRTSNIYRSDI